VVTTLELRALSLETPPACLATALARTAYVGNGLSNTVTPIDTATNTAGTAIGVGE
jgi:YVTN family beta-propeller protein